MEFQGKEQGAFEYQFIKRGHEIKVERVSWLLDDFFARKHVTWIWGEPSSGKSLFVQLMFLTQSRDVGVEWHHEENAGEAFNLFYIAGHDTSLELLVERERLVSGNGAVIYNEHPILIDVTIEKQRKWFIDFIKQMPEQVDAICFDTADNFSLSSDANDTRQALVEMAAFRDIAVSCNLSVILIGHSNKLGTALQGNNKRLGGADHVWRIMSGQNDIYMLQREKYRVTVHRQLSELKYKFVQGRGFVLTDEPFESKKKSRELNFEKVFIKMQRKFSRRDFLIECGTVSSRAIFYLMSLVKSGRLKFLGNDMYEKTDVVLVNDAVFYDKLDTEKKEQDSKSDFASGQAKEFLDDNYPF